MSENQGEILAFLKVAEATDYVEIADLAAFTFYESWIEPGNEADIRHYMKENFSEEVIASELQNPDILYCIVKVNDENSGYIKLQRNDQPENYVLEKPLAIHRVYIKKKFQNSGLGNKLMGFAIDLAKGEGFANVWLGVWNENFGAIRFYERYGFAQFGNYKFIMGDIVSDDYLLGLKL